MTYAHRSGFGVSLSAWWACATRVADVAEGICACRFLVECGGGFLHRICLVYWTQRAEIHSSTVKASESSPRNGLNPSGGPDPDLDPHHVTHRSGTTRAR